MPYKILLIPGNSDNMSPFIQNLPMSELMTSYSLHFWKMLCLVNQDDNFQGLQA